MERRVVSLGFEVAHEQAIARKKALLADFLRREADALEWARTHPADYARVLAAETGLPADIALAMVQKNSRRPVPMDQRVMDDQRVVVDTFQQAGEIEPRRRLEDAFVDLSRS